MQHVVEESYPSPYPDLLRGRMLACVVFYDLLGDG